MGIGEAAMRAGLEKEAVVAYEAAQSFFRRAGDPEASARPASRLGQAWWRQEAIARAQEAFDTARSLLETHPGTLLARVLVDLASLRGVSLHHYAEAIGHARRALELARTLDDQPILAAAARTLGNLLVRSNDLSGGIPLLEEALVLARRATDYATRRVRSAFPGAIAAIRTLHARGYRLHTTSGETSVELPTTRHFRICSSLSVALEILETHLAESHEL